MPPGCRDTTPQQHDPLSQVRGLCKDLSNTETLFESVRVYGDMKNSDISGMWYGHYSYGHLGGVWTNNLMHGKARNSGGEGEGALLKRKEEVLRICLFAQDMERRGAPSSFGVFLSFSPGERQFCVQRASGSVRD